LVGLLIFLFFCKLCSLLLCFCLHSLPLPSQAGRDTTASLLTWLFYELSQHPEVERRVVEEVDSVFGVMSAKERGDRAAAVAAATSNISHDSLRQLIYLEAVIMETLRLHPSIPINSKVTRRACTFPDGTKVPAGHIVSYSPYIFGRMESIWGQCGGTR